MENNRRPPMPPPPPPPFPYIGGIPGPAGRGIASITVLASGKWLIVYTDGTSQTLDTVPQDLATLAAAVEAAAEQAAADKVSIADAANQAAAALGTITNALQGAVAAKEAAEQSASDADLSKNASAHYADLAKDASDLAKTYSENAYSYRNAAQLAKDAAVSAKTDAVTAKNDAETAKDGAETAQTSAQSAQTEAEDARNRAEAWATGGSGGTPSATNNAKYYSEQAAESATEAASSAAAGTSALANEAPTYSTSGTYAVGDYVLYNGGLYRCNTAISTAEAWTSDHWTAVKISPELVDLKSAINDVKGTVDSNLFSTVSALNPYSGYNGTGKRINADGIIVADANYNTYRYTFSGLSVLKIVSDDKFIFQNASTRPSSAPNNYLVGSVHGAFNGIMTIPTGATNLYISTPATGGTASVSSVLNVIDKMTDELSKSTGYGITWESGFINSSGAEASNAGYMRTNYIPINAISCPVYYKLKVTSSVGYVALYDEGHNFIECIAGETTSVTEVSGMVVPNAKNVKYVRFSSNISNGYAPTVLFVSNGQYVITERSVKQSNLGSDILTLADGCNPIDYNGVYEGKYITETGAIGSSTSVWATDYIPLEEETTYYQKNVMNTYYAFYDSTKAFISGYSTLGDLNGSFTTPAGTAYGRFTLATSAFNYKNAWINNKNEMPSVYQLALNKSIKVYAGSGTDVSNPCDYSGEEITTFVKGICIGDSLTAGAFNTTLPTEGNQVYDKNSYPRSLERLTGIQITNAGHSGYTSAEWYSAYSSEDYSGHDFAIIQLGVNDQIRYHEFGDTSKTAFENIFTMLKTQNPKIKIFVANIIPALSYQAQGYLDFSDALLAWVQNKHLTDADIIPLDIQQFGHTDDSQAYNCGHLSAFGYNQLARDYKAYISWHMAQNKMEFRQVQFIGTEYSYSD